MIPRNEHPNPQFERTAWLNLNGEWEFESDRAMSGIDRRLFEKEHLDGKITVPFCPESKLSGIGDVDFHNCVWYRRDIAVPAEHKHSRVLLHFGAVDHTAHVYIDGKEIGTHMGGYASFTFDITEHLTDGRGSLCVCAVDFDRDPRYGHGKQSRIYPSHRCYYTRVTGIWQTVWLEFVPQSYIKSIQLVPDLENCSLNLEAKLCGKGVLQAEAVYEGRTVGSLSLNCTTGVVSGTMALSEKHVWELGEGRLYDLRLTFGEDRVSSYFGLRSIALDGYKFLFNGRSVFQRLVLDQGYYRDGIYTAPSDEALIKDIQISMDAGFNGARLHQKVFEPRFLYHCDRMGYMVWGEYGNWGIDYSNIACIPPFCYEWSEILERDFNHPSIIGWCPLNETWDVEGRRQNDDVLRTLYRMTRRLDPTRPCIDTSGNYHVETDIFDIHDYIQEPDVFIKGYDVPTPEEMLEIDRKRHVRSNLHQGPYIAGTPVFVSEYGGIKWDINSGNRDAWGYGNAPTTEDEFMDRYKRLTDALLDCPYMLGFCYTQLYDVEQEVNGVYTYDREVKFDPAFFKSVNTRTAAIEKE